MAEKARSSAINLNWFTVGVPLLAIALVIILTTRTNNVTRLIIASQTGNVDVVTKLLDNGVNPNAVNGTNSALITAIRNREPDVVKLLLSHEADPNFDAGTGVTPLTWAVRSGDLGMVKTLVQSGANPARRNADGKTASDEARNSPDILRLLSQPKRDQ
jgi:hypothetical protein